MKKKREKEEGSVKGEYKKANKATTGCEKWKDKKERQRTTLSGRPGRSTVDAHSLFLTLTLTLYSQWRSDR